MIWILLLVLALVLWAPREVRLPWRSSHAGQRCNRCWKPAPRLDPYIDGRIERWVCPMCVAELQIVQAPTLKPPRS